MKIELHEIPVREVVAGYVDNAEEGCYGYGGRLNIRPAYQREFVYKLEQRRAVIDSIKKNFPLNVMYWVAAADDTFELLDGQQRTLSICQYVKGSFSVDKMYFKNLTPEEKDALLNYKLMIYVCSEGTVREKLDWFKIVNIAGVELTEQENRNILFTGTWLTAAKKFFSKKDCAAQKNYKEYLKGSAIKQDFLETALKWIADRDKISITDYMAQHADDTHCAELWVYFQNVFAWVQVTFPNYRREMKGLPWGFMYNRHGKKFLDAAELERKIVELMEDDEVTRNAGVYEYLLDGDEKHLSLRKFSAKIKRATYERQNHKCANCGQEFEFKQMEGDHITPWSAGGKTTAENCQMLCKSCNRRKSNR